VKRFDALKRPPLQTHPSCIGCIVCVTTTSRQESSSCRLQQFHPHPPMRQHRLQRRRRPRRQAHRRPLQPLRRLRRQPHHRPPPPQPRQQRCRPRLLRRPGPQTAITRPGTLKAQQPRTATVITSRGQVLRRRKALPPCRLRCRPSRPVAEQSSAGRLRHPLGGAGRAKHAGARAISSSRAKGLTRLSSPAGLESFNPVVNAEEVGGKEYGRGDAVLSHQGAEAVEFRSMRSTTMTSKRLALITRRFLRRPPPGTT
jgi:hypothetical protein